jgi:hypothetical protein
MEQIIIGPVAGYAAPVKRDSIKKKPLDFHISYGTIYVHDEKNNCVSISRGTNGIVSIDDMWIAGEEIDPADCDYDFFNHHECPFIESELNDFIVNYKSYVGSHY